VARTSDGIRSGIDDVAAADRGIAAMGGESDIRSGDGTDSETPIGPGTDAGGVLA
jgi:hypothetical protein